MKRRVGGALVALAVLAGLLVWVTRVPASTPPRHVRGTGWRLAFDAGFPGSRLDTSVWSTCYPWGDTSPGCTNFGNQEYEWNLPSQDRVHGGALHLVSQPVATSGRSADGRPKEYPCRSGVVTSYPSFRFTYGYVQVVARIPSGYGLWSGLWMAAANLQWPPEIDMVEKYGPPQPDTPVTFHPAGAPQVQVHPATANLAVGWHTFGVDWTPTTVTWFIDGHRELSVNQHVPHQPMYFLANLADYKPPQGGKGCAGSLLIRSVKVWQR